MTIYIIIAIVLLIFILLPQYFDRISFPISSILLFFLGTFRAVTVGTDTGGVYYSNWNCINWDMNSWNRFTPFEPGYNILMLLVKDYISNEYEVMYGLTFAISFILTLYFIRKESQRPIFSLFVFYTTYLYMAYFNIMRQCFAMSIILVLIYNYMHRKISIYWYIIGVIVISQLFHSSIMFYLIVPLLNYLSEKNIQKWILYVILACSFFLFLNVSVITGIVPYFQSILSERYFGYVEWGLQIDSQYSFMEMLMYTLFLSFCIYFHKGNKFSVYFWLVFIGVIIRSLFINIVPMMARIYILGNIAMVIMVVNIYFSLETRLKRYIILAAVILFGFVILTNSLSHNYGELVPYKNWIIDLL